MKAILLAALLATAVVSSVQAAEAPPPFVTRGLPGPGLKALDPLIGRWKVEMSLFMAGGTPDKPATSRDLVATVERVAGGHALRQTIDGTMGGQPYHRVGLLDYSNLDQRYEWITVDAVNSAAMIYKAAPGSGLISPIVMTGDFTDPGFLGEDSVGKTIGQRTVLTIQSNDRYVMEIYFTPPGGQERLIDRKVFTRLK